MSGFPCPCSKEKQVSLDKHFPVHFWLASDHEVIKHALLRAVDLARVLM
jgi:hypothetical protein